MIWFFISRMSSRQVPEAGGRGAKPVPVETAEIERGAIELRRTFSGTLESRDEFVVSPKITARVAQLYVDLGDMVKSGQVIAALDREEYLQAVAQAEADVMVARANAMEAKNALEIAALELERFKTLRSRGVASESQFDAARAEHLSKISRHEVAKAQVTRAEAMLETARIQLGYTSITAQWPNQGPDQDNSRAVAARYANEGEIVAANAPLVSIVSLDPITGVIFVTEKDYGRLKIGQAASMVTDAYPDRRFEGRIDRIAPVFSQATRQAKVEMVIQNPDHLLKPGMFIRVTVVLDRVEDAVMVPGQALTRRNDRTGIFVVDESAGRALWREVVVGIQENGRVQVIGSALSGLTPDLPLGQSGGQSFGRVVTLGQQLLADGAAIRVSEPSPDPEPPGTETRPETPVR